MTGFWVSHRRKWTTTVTQLDEERRLLVEPFVKIKKFAEGIAGPASRRICAGVETLILSLVGEDYSNRRPISRSEVDAVVWPRLASNACLRG